MDFTVLAVRLVVSLAVVLGLVWFLMRQAKRRGIGSGGDGQRFTVVGRHSLGRNAGVTVVRVGDEALVLGVTEQSVQLLARTDLASVSGLPGDADGVITRRVAVSGVRSPGRPSPAARPVIPAPRAATATESAVMASVGGRGALAGSALSPGTWSGALEALRERTTRR